MIARTRSLLSLMALALLASACLADPVEPKIITEPPPPPVRFDAVSANDHPLPAFINADGSSEVGRQLLEASLLLLHPDSLRLILSTRVVGTDGELEASSADTLWARIQPGNSTYILSELGEHPFQLSDEAIPGDESIVITVEQPLPASAGVAGTYPVELLFKLVR